MPKSIYGNVVGATDQKPALIVQLFERSIDEDPDDSNPSAPKIMVADYSPSEIYEHILNGGAAYISLGTSDFLLYPISEASATTVKCTVHIGEIVSNIVIYEDKSVVIDREIDPLPLIVTIDEDAPSFKASHSSTEIHEHVKAGGTVLFLNEALCYCSLSYSRNSTASFASIDPSGNETCCIQTYRIDDKKNIQSSAVWPVDLEIIGDIDTALDAILAIQNELIGGDSV